MLKSRTFVTDTIEEIDSQKEAILRHFGNPDFSETLTMNGLGQYVVSLTMNIPDDPVPGGIQRKIHRR